MSQLLRRSTIAALILGVFCVSFLALQSEVFAFQNADADGPTSASVQTDSTPDSTSANAPEASTMFMLLSYLIPLLGVVGLGFTFWKSKWVSEQEVGSEKMARIAQNITDGAMSFLKAEYSILTVFVIAVAVLLGYAGQTQGEQSSPLIALSLRYDRIDNFWFTLLHELSHVLNKDKTVVDVDVAQSKSTLTTEKRANADASRWLIDPKVIRSFVMRHGPRFSKSKINQFSNLHKVHPGIVVGQLHHSGDLDYRKLRGLLEPVCEKLIEYSISDGWE